MVTRQNGPVSDLPDAPTAPDGTVVLCGRELVEVEGRRFMVVWHHTLKVTPRSKRSRRSRATSEEAG